jgi:putative aldouronate transport system substrate-binding protein
MQPRIAAGQALPDLFIVPPTWSNAGVFRLASQGMLTRLDDMLPLHAPDIYNIFSQYPELRGLHTAPNGHIYTIADTPKFVNDYVVHNAIFIRQDWLDALGLPVPASIDDWHRTLTAFRDNDLNGTGNVIPFSGFPLWNALTVFGGGFGLPVGVGAWWYDDSGQVFCVYNTPEFREFITTMSRWHEEGLLDLEINRDEPNFQSLVSTNVVGAFVHLAELETQYNNFLAVSGFDGFHTLVEHPADIRPLTVLKRSPTWNHYAIPASSENAELVLQWMNFVWGTDEGVGLTVWGLEGVTYEWVNGQRQFTDFVLNNPDGLDPHSAKRSLGAGNTVLVRTPGDVYAALNMGNNAVAYAEALGDAMTEPFPDVMATEEEQAILDRILPDFNTFVNESLVRFLIGVDPIDQFDSFIDTLYSIGLEELLAIRQAQFDRSGVVR